MVLTSPDIARLESLGFGGFYEYRGGFYRLANRGGYCVFLDPERGLCKVYEYRPIGCRAYPLVYDEEKGVTLDAECPLSGALTRGELVKGLAELEKALLEVEKTYNYRVNWRLVRASATRLISSRR